MAFELWSFQNTEAWKETRHVNDCGISNRSSFQAEFIIRIRSFQEKRMSITPVSDNADEYFHSFPTCFTLNPPGKEKEKRKVKEALESNGTAIHGKTP